MIQKSKIYFMLLIVILLAITFLSAQIGVKALGWQAFHPIILSVLVVGWGLIFLYIEVPQRLLGKQQRIVNVGEVMGKEAENFRVCKKCLTREMIGQEEYFRSLWEYIENLDRDIKTPELLYEDRLTVCRNCEMLLEGMCRSCGCYVELRAAIEKNSCPWEKW